MRKLASLLFIGPLLAGLLFTGTATAGMVNQPGLNPASNPVVVTGDWTFDGLVDIGTVETFTDTDQTPDVSTGIYWNTFTNTLTITDFDGTPTDGQKLYVFSKAAITFDCTSSGLDCGTTDIVTASGDATFWIYTGTNWQLISRFDASVSAVFLNDVVDDLTPQLGGALDVNGNEITGSIDIHSDDDVILELGDNAGVNKVSIRDSNGNEVAAIDSDGTISAHDIHLTHTATGDDQHTANITTDGAGFGDIKSLDIDYTTGDLQSGDDSAVILINIDESGASGGEVFGVLVLSSENNVAVTGLKVGESVNVIRQASGGFGDMDSFLIIAANMLTEALSATPADLPYFLAQGDTITIADAAKFTAIEFVIATGASANGIVPTFEFWNGSSWVFFTPIDGTDGWRETGAHQVSWDLTDVSTWALDGNTEYPIRITRTKITLITDPVGSQVQIASSTVYGWNKDGDIDIRQLTLSGAANFQDNTLSRVNLLDYGEITNAIGDTGGGAQDIDLELGNVVTLTQTVGQTTLSFINSVASDEGMSFTIICTDCGSNGGLIFPGSVTWMTPNGVTPTLPTSGVVLLSFFKTDVGATGWFGFANGRTRELMFSSHAKIGATGGWVLGAANDLAYLATIPQSQTNSTFIVPISGFEVGETITEFCIVGQIESGGNAVTITGDLRVLTAAAADITDASVSTVTTGSQTAQYLINDCTSGITQAVASGETYYVVVKGTTGATTDAVMIGTTVTLLRD